MKLSEAIKKGSTFHTQCRGMYYRPGATCALGAAHFAAFKNVREIDPAYVEGWGVTEDLKSKFPELSRVDISITDLNMKDVTLKDQIVHLNDFCHYSREQIATLLEAHGL